MISGTAASTNINGVNPATMPGGSSAGPLNNNNVDFSMNDNLDEQSASSLNNSSNSLVNGSGNGTPSHHPNGGCVGSTNGSTNGSGSGTMGSNPQHLVPESSLSGFVIALHRKMVRISFIQFSG